METVQETDFEKWWMEHTKLINNCDDSTKSLLKHTAENAWNEATLQMGNFIIQAFKRVIMEGKWKESND